LAIASLFAPRDIVLYGLVAAGTAAVAGIVATFVDLFVL
jgi:hypothetical protein